MKKYVYKDNEYSSAEYTEIEKGLAANLDVSVFANPAFSFTQMQIIREGLEQGINAKLYANPDIDSSAMSHIKDALVNGLHIEPYIDPHFNYSQMLEIIGGLESGVDVSVFANPVFNERQMSVIREALEDQIDVEPFLNPELTAEQMYLVKVLNQRGLLTDDVMDNFMEDEDKYSSMVQGMVAYCIENDYDYKELLNPAYDDEQRRVIFYGLTDIYNWNGPVDYTIYANPAYQAPIMHCIYDCLCKGVNVLPYLEEGYNIGQCGQICEAINNNIDLDIILNHDYPYDVMRDIIYLEREGMDTREYFKQGFNVDQLKVYMSILKEPKSPYAKEEDYSGWFKPEYPAHKMKKFREQLNCFGKIYDYFDYEFSSSVEEALNVAFDRGINLIEYAKQGFSGKALDEILQALEYCDDVTPMLNLAFTYNQMKELRLGIQHGVDVSIYANPDYSWSTMYQIRLMLEPAVEEVPVCKYPDLDFEEEEGYISCYHPSNRTAPAWLNQFTRSINEYNSEQIEAIFWGFLRDIDVTEYLDPSIPAISMKNTYWLHTLVTENFSQDQLAIIQQCIASNLPIISLAKPDYTVEQMQLIAHGLKEGIDPYNFANPVLSLAQMEIIYKCEKEGLDATKLNNPKFSLNQLKLIYFALSKSLAVTHLAKPGIPEKEMCDMILEQLKDESDLDELALGDDNAKNAQSTTKEDQRYVKNIFW